MHNKAKVKTVKEPKRRLEQSECSSECFCQVRTLHCPARMAVTSGVEGICIGGAYGLIEDVADDSGVISQPHSRFRRRCHSLQAQDLIDLSQIVEECISPSITSHPSGILFEHIVSTFLIDNFSSDRKQPDPPYRLSHCCKLPLKYFPCFVEQM